LTQNLTLYAQWEIEPSVSPSPKIDPVFARSSVVSGTGNAGCTVIVTLPNGVQIKAVVEDDGNWTISVSAETVLMEGQIISATQICRGMKESSPEATAVLPHPGHTVTGFVSPLVVNDLGFGPAFLRLFDVVVELRATFRMPAPPELRTVAVPVNEMGLGAFTINNVPEGNYVLYIKRPGYLARPMNVAITANSPDTVTLAPPGSYDNGIFNLWPGDVNGDLRVDNDDIIAIIEAISVGANYPSPLYNPSLDLNADSLIDNEDIMLVLAFWNRTVLDYPGAENVDIYS